MHGKPTAAGTGAAGAGTSRPTLPRGLTSARAKLVYLYLSTNGTASLVELERELEMRKLTLYGVLRTLRDRDLISRDGERYAPA